MSRRRLHTVLVTLLGVTGTVNAAPAWAQAPGTTQAARAELGARIDSLVAVYEQHAKLLKRRDSLRAARAVVLRTDSLRTDTVTVGPFLFVDRTVPAPGAIAALEDAWQSYENSVGRAAERLSGIVITRSLLRSDLVEAGSHQRVHRFEPMATGRLDHAAAAKRVIVSILMDAMPVAVSEWLDGAGLIEPSSLAWAYRDLATSGSRSARGCFARDVQACRTALTGDEAADLAAITRASLLQHVLAIGGTESYARLLDDAPDVATRLAHAADRPIDEVMISWRSAVQDARPRALAGIAQAGVWTVAWLIGFALFAMRSTRWRLG
jgi:hypothetical protein